MSSRTESQNDSKHVFISYKHQEPDSTLAHALATSMREAGHEVFIDTAIRWGEDWVKTIREALQRSTYLLLLLSRESSQSSMVVEELTIARDLAANGGGLPVILPVRIKLPFGETLPYELALKLETIQQETWEGPNDLIRIQRKLLETIGGGTQWPSGQTPEATSAEKRDAPLPAFDPRDLIIPGGAVEVDCPCYVTRDADARTLESVDRGRGIATVRGPRQSGKTSLIMRVFASVRERNRARAVFVDFQGFQNHSFQSVDALWKAITSQIVRQLKVKTWSWNEASDYDVNFTDFLADHAFAGDPRPLLLCLDEVDRVFDRPVKEEFFNSARYFFNKGAHEPDFALVRWLYGTSLEPQYFIEDPSVSPFNIGPRIGLDMFTRDEVRDFAGKVGLQLTDEQIGRIMQYVGGQPYLVHLLLYHLARSAGAGGRAIPDAMLDPKLNSLFDAQTAGGSVFREHLHRYLSRLQEEERLRNAFLEVIEGRGGGFESAKVESRLEGAGLIRRNESGDFVVSCDLYKQFFLNELT